MCLIAYVPQGASIPRDIFIHAGNVNRDGFGVMSAEDGIRKFFGRKALRKARLYSAELSQRNVTHAVHWRYATHGAVTESLCHPFTTPNGAAHVMHNGILHTTAADATADKSDTVLFVERMMHDAPTLEPGAVSPYWGDIENAIGARNRMVILTGTTFYLLNEDAGLWLDGVWYSNDYSLPSTLFEEDYAEWCSDCYLDLVVCKCPKRTAPVDNTPGDWRYADGKRYNPVSFRWEWPEDKKEWRDAISGPVENWQEYLRRAFPLDVEKPLYSSGPTLDAMLPTDNGGYN